MSEPIRAALTQAEWTGVLANRSALEAIRKQFNTTPFSAHALAALFLYDEPYGFTGQDVDDEHEVAAYCRRMAAEATGRGQPELSQTFALLSERHEIRAMKIAALLPQRATIPPEEIAERAD